MSIQLSIIIPVYNSAKYLAECLDSIVIQSVTDIEVICVNDGSTDDSLCLLQDYAAKDSRIIVLNQTNQGVSVARNNGMKLAKGVYIGFVDADDYLSTDYFEKFFNHFGSDLIALYPSGFSEQPQSGAIIDQLFKHMLLSDSFNSVWSKVFKKEIIEDNKVIFPEGKRLGEDARFILEFLKNAQTVSLLTTNQGYFYRENTESATKGAVKDYSLFEHLFSEFNLDHKIQFRIELAEDELLDIKLKKLLHTYFSALSIYFRSNIILDKQKRHKLIKKSMDEFSLIYKQTAHHEFWKMTRSKFEQFILSSLIKQQFWKLKMAYAYSHFRNGIK